MLRSGQQFYSIFGTAPLRLQRLGRHLLMVFRLNRVGPAYGRLSVLQQIGFWWLELIFYVLDLVAIPIFYEVTGDWLKARTRSLTAQEIQTARMVFGAGLPYNRIRVDERAQLGPRQKRFAYVSFYTINFWGPIPLDLLIHELVHVWQYEKMGAVYIPWALLAQRSPRGYDYGGLEQLERLLRTGQSLADLNLEQQAEVAADYFQLLRGQRPHWGRARSEDMPVYLEILRSGGLRT